MHARAASTGRAVAWAAAIAMALWIGVTWGRRVTYPYDLEWMEGGMLAHAWWMLRGEPLYGPPNPEFVPYIYPPGYTAILAALGRVVPLSLPLARGVSVLGTLAAVAALGVAVRRAGGSWLVAAAAGATFLATWSASGTFMDVARPDALAVALLAWSVVAVGTERRGTEVAGGLLLAAAFVVKHNLALFGLPLGFALWWRSGWAPALRFVLASAGPALLVTGAVQVASGGHYLTYLLEVPLTHPTDGNLDRMQWAPRELGTPVAVVWATLVGAAWARAMGEVRAVPRWVFTFVPAGAGMVVAWWLTYPGGFQSNPYAYRVQAGICAFAMVVLPLVGVLWAGGSWWQRRQGEVGRPLSVTWVLGAGLLAVGSVSAVSMRAHIGGFVNVYLPLYWVLAWAFGMVLVRLERHARLGGLVPVLIAAQLAWAATVLEPGRRVPSPADRAANDRLVSVLRDAPGPVLSPFAAWLPTYAGHPPSLHYMGLWDLEYEGGPYHDLRDPIVDAVRRRRWRTVVAGSRPFPYPLLEHYDVDLVLVDPDEEPAPGRRKAGVPVVGFIVRPDRILVPRE